MALKSIFKIVFKNSVNTGFVANDKVVVYWNTTTSDFVVRKNLSIIYTGADLGRDEYITNSGTYTKNYTVSIEPKNSTIYQFCDGGDLNYFEFSQFFPYATRIVEVNSTMCNTNIVCDLNFLGIAEIVKPSTATATDGQITVTAETSNGTLKYSLQDEDYSDMTNTTGVFTGLGIGSYIVYAKDPYNCVDSILVTLDYDATYGPKFRMEYDCLNGDVSTIDIEEIDYAGSVTEVIGTDTPFVVRLRGEDSELFTPILTTECTIGLTSLTNFQFLDLFTQDDRKYRVIAKKNGTEFWRGFITPGLYQEQYYTETNYYVNAEATDQLVTLKELDFLDKDGNEIKGVNSLIKVISFILAKTDLDLPIRSAVNIWETDMDQTASDDPLEQTHIDTSTYYETDGDPMNCYEVLQNIVKSFGSRLFQWQGYWYIIPVDFYTDSIEYREFDVNGDYVTNGTFNPLFDIKIGTDVTRAVWTNRTQNLEVRGAFGYCEITHNLVKPRLSVFNGSFNDIGTETKVYKPITIGSSTITLKRDVIVDYDGWSLITNGNTANYYYANLARGNGDTDKGNYCGLIYSESDSSTKGQDAFFLSEAFDITYSASDAIVFKFDFLPETLDTKTSLLPPFIRFRFRLRLGTYYLQGNGSWTTDTDFQWIDVFVSRESFNNWQTIEIKADCPDVSGEVVTDYQVSLMHGSFAGDALLGCWDYGSEAAIKAIATVDLPLGFTVGLIDFATLVYVCRFYRLVGETATSLSDFADELRDGVSYFGALAPDDFHGTTNKKVWVNYEEFIVQDLTDLKIDNTPKCAVRKFDNVYFEMLPNNRKSPEEFLYRTDNSISIKDNNKFDILNGDVPNGITNAENLYVNWYRYSDGTPTVQWNREGVDESEPLLGLLSKRIIELHNLPKFKLTGTLKTDTFYGFRNSYLEASTGKYYIPMAMSINDKRNEYDVEIQEVGQLTSTGIDGIGEFDELAFTNGIRSQVHR